MALVYNPFTSCGIIPESKKNLFKFSKEISDFLYDKCNSKVECKFCSC